MAEATTMDNNNNTRDIQEDGLFNYQDILDNFMKMDGTDSELAEATKLGFMSNMVQSAFGQQLAQQLAQYQTSLGQSNMNHAADLELRNTLTNMENEFNFGMASMGAQFDLQNDYANAQYDRDIGVLSATGEQTRLTEQNAQNEQRMNRIVEGEQQRLTDSNRISDTGNQERLSQDNAAQNQQATDTNRIQVTGKEERLTSAQNAINQQLVDSNRIKETGSEERLSDSNRATEQRATDTNRITTTGTEERKTIQTQGSEQRLTDTNRITTTGDQERKTIDFSDQIAARKQSRDSGYSKNMARSF